MQKLPIDLIQAKEKGNIVAEEGRVRAVEVVNDVKAPNGSFDAVRGILTLTIPGYDTIQISGLATATSMGTGPAGSDGKEGERGLDGIMGSHGLRGEGGCPGPRGAQGDPGRQGPRGLRGPAGPTGTTGMTGPAGLDGSVQVFIQEEDPAKDGRMLMPGALWVRP